MQVEEILNSPERYTIINRIQEIEDYLQEKEVFLNGLRNTPCHMDAYMTVVDFANLDKAIALGDFDEDLVDSATNWWLTNPNSQPPIKMVALHWRRALGKVPKPTPESTVRQL